MELLILGGTKFVGRWLAELARSRGHAVTLFHRGRTNPELFPDLEHIHGDRDGGLAALGGRRWDVVVDTCGYIPRLVRDSSALLAAATGHYTFVSTCSVYAAHDRPGRDEDDPLARLEDPSVEKVTAATYGGLKALCEQAVVESFAGRSLIVRPGLIVGPHDPTDRFTYWPVRLATCPVVLGAPAEAIVEFTDVRDLAAFILDGAERRLAGVFNISGPGAEKIRFGELVRECRRAIPSAAEVIFPTAEFLRGCGVSPWTDLPLWTSPDEPGFSTRSVGRAAAEGLRSRPVRETVADTLAWAQEGAPSDAGGSAAEYRPIAAGLSRAREEEIIARWRASGEPGSALPPGSQRKR